MLTAWLAAAAAAEVVDRIVAVVNDDIITMSELEQTSRAYQDASGALRRPKSDKAFLRQTLEELIDMRLARAEAKRRGITVSDKDLEQALQDFRQRHNLPDDAALAQVLGQAGISLNEFKQQITDQIMQERLMAVMVGAKVKVDEGEVRRFYDQEFPKTAGEMMHLRIITLPYPPGATHTQKEELQLKVESLLKEARQGVSFEELRRKHDLSMQDLGFIPVSDLDPQLAGFLKGLRPGETAPVKSPQGFQLIQLVGRKTGQPQSFEEAAPQIRRFLRTQAMRKEFSEWVKGLREKAHIKIML
ncbi:MAG: SurA N-terminal domain-containing protein [Thermodesulfobacteriota bacterium]